MSSNERQFCTFTLGDGFFGVAVETVQEVLRYQDMTSVPLAPPEVTGLINLRGQIVTAVELRRRLSLPERPADSRPMNIIVGRDDGAVSLLVDQIGDVLLVDPDTFEAPPPTTDAATRALLIGVCKLEDRLLLVLDVDKVLEVDTPADESREPAFAG